LKNIFLKITDKNIYWLHNMLKKFQHNVLSSFLHTHIYIYLYIHIIDWFLFGVIIIIIEYYSKNRYNFIKYKNIAIQYYLLFNLNFFNAFILF